MLYIIVILLFLIHFKLSKLFKFNLECIIIKNKIKRACWTNSRTRNYSSNQNSTFMRNQQNIRPIANSKILQNDSNGMIVEEEKSAYAHREIKVKIKHTWFQFCFTTKYVINYRMKSICIDI